MPEQLSRIELKLAEIEGKVDATFKSTEKMRKYFLWTMIITIAVIVLPILVIPFVIPAFLQSLTLPSGF